MPLFEVWDTLGFHRLTSDLVSGTECSRFFSLWELVAFRLGPLQFRDVTEKDGHRFP